MEEIPKEITLALSFKTVLITMFSAGLAIIIASILKPSILVLRDLTAWKLIDIFFLNEKTKNNIERLQRYKKRVATQFSNFAEYEIDEKYGAVISARIDGEHTSENYAFIHDDTKSFIEKEIIALEENIKTKTIRLSFILQHLEIKEVENPLTELRKKYAIHYQNDMPRKVKVDYDWTSQDALIEIKKHL
ncbi:hypothetical protein [Vreelandella aquamarina]|uniref:Uncharacterized protein n=1 Tax=Vreelandella aquamarina TaxID=77097 RepID=A0A857GQ79_9GAMM|nr:hypothetical protein [Halomonas meridiana]QHD49141.1 hypothetical protein CTT34_05245 [Halomonas meridiana]